MEPVDRYGGDDFRSIEADNTSAFNCRAATGSSHWSNHAYGRAIDVNPIENPYVERRRELAPRERAVPRPLAAPGRHGVRGRRARRGVPRERLGMGRQLDRAASRTTSTSPPTADRVARVLRGALAASVTPLRDGGAALDEDAFGPVVDFLAAGGLDGLLALGTNGEGILLSRRRAPARRRALRRGARRPSPGRRPLRRAVDRRHGRARRARGRGRRRRGRGDRAAVLQARRRVAARALRRRGRAPARRCPFYVYEFAITSGYAVPPDRRPRACASGRPNLAGLKVSDRPWEELEPYLIEGLDVFVGSEGADRARAGPGRRRRGLRAGLGVPRDRRRRRARRGRRSRRAAGADRPLSAPRGAQARARPPRRADPRGRARAAARADRRRAGGARRGARRMSSRPRSAPRS